MFNPLKHWLGETNPGQSTPQVEPDSRTDSLLTRHKFGVTIDQDAFGPEAREAIGQEIIQRAGAPLFHGTVEHAYSKRAAGAADQCPRCHAPTQKHCANFIYATDRATRAMLAPAGFFCTACPTVIIDDELIAAGVKPGFKFRGVLGIDDPDKKEPNLFHTWNGQKPVYIFDENQQCMGLETLGANPGRVGICAGSPWGPAPSHDHQKQKQKRKRKLAKLARKRNRRR